MSVNKIKAIFERKIKDSKSQSRKEAIIECKQSII